MREEIGDGFRFGRSETQAVTSIAASKPADGAVTKATAVVEDDEQPTAEWGDSLTLSPMIEQSCRMRLLY